MVARYRDLHFVPLTTGRQLSVAGKFEIYRDNQGQYRFRLKSGNGQVIASGQGYGTKKACLSGIESIRRNAASAELVDQTD